MVVCKFFLKGNCKFGNRCFNEHVRDNQNSYRQGNNQYNQPRGAPWNQPRGNQPTYARSPFHQEQSHNQHHQFHHSYEQHNRNDGRQSNHRRNDKFHWSSGGGGGGSNNNSFAVLSDDHKPSTPVNNQGFQRRGFSEPTPPAEDELIIKSIVEDMKTWAESNMWPYSCYSCKAKDVKVNDAYCVPGLADIHADELRVIYMLHGKDVYKNIIDEVNLTYMRRKDELFAMSATTRSAILSEVRLPASCNPSASLAIHAMYGPGTEFKDSAATNPSPVAAVSVPTSHPPEMEAAIDTKPVETATAATIGSMFGAAAGGDASAFAATSSTASGDTRYTDREQLTSAELEQFEATSFVLGNIPTRPPPRALCV